MDSNVIYGKNIQRIRPKQSANTVFNYMKSFKYLDEIIRDMKMYPRYCLEDISDLNISIKKIYVAMKCFCDIPLHNIESHKAKYGNYCIGLTKEWAKNNELQQILYCEENSKYNKYISNLFNSSLNGKESEETKTLLNHLIKYWKPSFNKIDNNYNYDDREWRFVPNLDSTNELTEIMIDKEIDNESIMEYYNSELKQQSYLTISPKDIKYIFVQHEKEKDKLINTINLLQLNDKDRIHLYSRIHVWDEEKGDF